MWDSVLVTWPFVTIHVMKLNMSKDSNCIFLQDLTDVMIGLNEF